MILELAIVAYLIGVVVSSVLYGRDARRLHDAGNWYRGDRERAWLAAVLWPLSMWLEVGFISIRKGR